jgi:hypothetical protein
MPMSRTYSKIAGIDTVTDSESCRVTGQLIHHALSVAIDGIPQPTQSCLLQTCI